MSVYLIAFMSSVVLYAAFIIVTCYMEYCRGKCYEVMSGISLFLQVSVMLTFVWWFLERFFSGLDSGFGWWLSAIAIGEVISSCLSIAANRICEEIWLKDEDAEITTVMVRKGLKTAVNILTLVLCVGFIILFIHGLFANEFDGTGEIIAAVLVIALFAFGAFDGIKTLIRQ